MTAPNIRFKRSAVAGKRPTSTQLPLGELALNTYDGQLFTQVDTGGVGIGTTVISLTPWKEIFGTGAVFYENNVGIGSNNPAEKLSVEGDARISNDLTVGGNLFADGSNLAGVVKNIIGGDSISIVDDNSGSYTINFVGDATGGISSIYTEVSGVAEIRADVEIRGDLEIRDNVEIDGDLQVDGFADFHNDVRILGKLEILNEVEVDTIIGDGSGLSGIVTGLTAGSGISITNTGGIYEIASTGSGIGTGILSEIDTLESVTDRGNHTTNTVTVGGLNVFGISSFNDKVYVQGPLHAGNTASGSVGTINQVLVSTGIGVTWKNIAGLTNPSPNSGATEAGAFRETHKYVALPQQRYIFVDYMPNYLDIFVNGVKLAEGEYTATDGHSIYFSEELFGGDTVEIHAYSPVANWIESINNKDLTILRDNYSFVATQSMTTYDVPHNDGFIDIFVNGVRLNSTEYSSVNDQTIVFNERFFGGEKVDIHVYNRYSSLISSSSKMIDTPPSSSSDVGIPGQTAYDDNYLYVCTASNTWKRTVLEDW
tara:strand:- start:1399 stop:3018 length:1620 start_codon:yes stop_codon:yes gene_type:complete